MKMVGKVTNVHVQLSTVMRILLNVCVVDKLKPLILKHIKNVFVRACRMQILFIFFDLDFFLFFLWPLLWLFQPWWLYLLPYLFLLPNDSNIPNTLWEGWLYLILFTHNYFITIRIQYCTYILRITVCIKTWNNEWCNSRVFNGLGIDPCRTVLSSLLRHGLVHVFDIQSFI